MLNFPDLVLAKQQLHDLALMEIEYILRKSGSSLSQFLGIPNPNNAIMKELSNRLLLEEFNYDAASNMIIKIYIDI